MRSSTTWAAMLIWATVMLLGLVFLFITTLPTRQPDVKGGHSQAEQAPPTRTDVPTAELPVFELADVAASRVFTFPDRALTDPRLTIYGAADMVPVVELVDVEHPNYDARCVFVTLRGRGGKRLAWLIDRKGGQAYLRRYRHAEEPPAWCASKEKTP